MAEKCLIIDFNIYFIQTIWVNLVKNVYDNKDFYEYLYQRKKYLKNQIILSRLVVKMDHVGVTVIKLY